MAESSVSISARRTVHGVSGGVEKILSAFRQKADSATISPKLKQLRKEEVGDAECGRRGKVVLYTTSVKAVRSTHEQCKQLVHILRSHRILFTNKDVFLHPDYGRELAERMGASKDTSLPQLFVGGEWLGSGETVLEMNERGELEEVLSEYKGDLDSCMVECGVCGGHRFVLCLWCGGSKKGIKNAFNDLKCTVCNQNGLQLCPKCSS